MRRPVNLYDHQPQRFGRHSLARRFLVRGLMLAAGAAVVVSFSTGALDIRQLRAVAGLSGASGHSVEARESSAALSIAVSMSRADCRPFVCASGPRAKWVSAPPPSAAANEPADQPSEPLVLRSGLTGMPYPAAAKGAAIVD